MTWTGSNISHCSITHSWSPDSRFFLTASLAPRMNVDNGFNIFKYNGIGPVVSYFVLSVLSLDQSILCDFVS